MVAIASALLLGVACGAEQRTTAVVQSPPTLPPTTASPTAAPTSPPPTATTIPSPTQAPTAPAAITATAPTAIQEATGGASDLPALAPENAPPLPKSQTTADSADRPVRLAIPAIQLDLQPVPVGLDQKGVPVVPKHDVGWFTGSTAPGEGSNVILWGHVLRWLDSPDVPAPFERIHTLKPGAEIRIVTAGGTERRYRVTEQVRTRPDDVSYLYPTLGERLTLVSCIGDKVIRKGELTKEFRLVTLARPVE